MGRWRFCAWLPRSGVWPSLRLLFLLILATFSHAQTVVFTQDDQRPLSIVDAQSASNAEKILVFNSTDILLLDFDTAEDEVVPLQWRSHLVELELYGAVMAQGSSLACFRSYAFPSSVFLLDVADPSAPIKVLNTSQNGLLDMRSISVAGSLVAISFADPCCHAQTHHSHPPVPGSGCAALRLQR